MSSEWQNIFLMSDGTKNKKRWSITAHPRQEAMWLMFLQGLILIVERNPIWLANVDRGDYWPVIMRNTQPFTK